MMMQAAQRNQLHHRCTRHRRAVKSQVTAAARRPGRPSAPQVFFFCRRHRVLTRTTECCIGCNSAPFQPGRQRVPERMHTVPTFLTHRDVGGPGVLDQDLVQMILVGKRAYRRGMPDEHLRAVAGRAAGANVVDHRPADVFEQRQLHPVAGLGLHHRQPVARPVEIAELKTLDVDAAQPEPGDQQNDRVIPFAAWVAPVDRLQDLGHVGRVPHRRDPGLPARPGRRDRLQHRAVDQPMAAGEPQERPYGAQFVLHRLGLVAYRAGLLDLAWPASSGLGSSLSDLLKRLLPCALSARLRDGAGPA